MYALARAFFWIGVTLVPAFGAWSSPEGTSRIDRNKHVFPRDVLGAGKPRGPAQAFLAKGVPYEVLNMNAVDGWVQVRTHHWVAAEDLQLEGETRAGRLFDLIRSSFQEPLGNRIPLKSIRASEVRQVDAKLRGGQTRLRFGVAACNRSGLSLTKVFVELSLLDRRGKEIVERSIPLKNPATLKPGQEIYTEIEVDLTKAQLKHYHKRRVKVLFFTFAE